MLQRNILHYRWAVILHFLGQRKEIYYKAAKQDGRIGTATVYRMVNKLEEIGAISRKNMYKIACGSGCEVENACTIEFDDDTVVELSAKKCQCGK